MFNKRAVWIAMGMFLMLLIVGCTIFSSQQNVVAQQQTPVPLADHELPEPITLTISNMSWEQNVYLANSDVIRQEGSWEKPDGDAFNILYLPYPGTNEVRPWYVTLPEEDRVSRRILSSGIGTDPEPEWRAFNLEEDEYVLWQVAGYYIELTDDSGNKWLWTAWTKFYQETNYGEVLVPLLSQEESVDFYMQFEIGQEVLVTDYFSQRGKHDVLMMEPIQ